MTREEAIKVLNMVEAYGLADEAKRVAIEALQAKTDGDLISRADAIEAIQTTYCKPCKKRGDDHNEVRCRVCNFDDAIIQIDALPSAEAEWIPCSERLPKEYAQYLVCFESGECYIYWLEDSDWARGMAEKEGIIAWMPLPKPYGEDRRYYEFATEQMEHDVMYEPTYNPEDGSM